MPEKKQSGTPEAPTAGSTRRRTINRPTGTFAHFLDALISYDFAYFSPKAPGFTAYKQALSERLQIHPRQLSRLLSGQTLPETRLLKRLCFEFPLHIQTEGWIPKLGWPCLARDMELLPEGSVISILVGHLSADDIDAISMEVVRDIALSIVRRSFRYVYVVSPISARLRKDELNPSHVADRLRLRILAGWLDVNREAKRNARIERFIAESIMIFQTATSEEAAHFWCRLPRYVVASNLLADPQSVFSNHELSAAFDSGSVPYSAIRTSEQKHVPGPVLTGGWSYLEREYDHDFREMFKKMVKGGLLLNSEHKNQGFPKPGLSRRAAQTSRVFNAKT